MKNNIKQSLVGPVFSLITPFSKNGKIDFLSLEKYINYLYKRGARVFYLMVYNSRFGLLDDNEIIKLNLFCIKTVKKIDKKNIIICAEPYFGSTEKSIKLINLFHKKGADIVSVIFGEKYYSDDQVFSHFKKIHKNTNCYLLLHQQLLENGLSGNPPLRFYNLNLLKKICTLKRFIAMKEDAKNENFTKKICKNLKRKVIIITSGGGKKQWLKARKFGCQSWLSGVSNLDPKIAFDFYKNSKIRNKIFLDNYFQNIENPFFRDVKKFGWHLTIKAYLESYGHFQRFERRPLKELSKSDYMYIKNRSKKMHANSFKFSKQGYFN